MKSTDPITKHDWSNLHAHMFDCGGMEGDIVVITTANADEARAVYAEWQEGTLAGTVDTNFAIYLDQKGYPSIDACKGVNLDTSE